MASTVIFDPQAIKQYRGKIKGAVNDLESQLRKTDSAINVVSGSWKDDHFKQFQQRFDVDKEQIRELCKVLNIFEGELLLNLEKAGNAYLATPTHL